MKKITIDFEVAGHIQTAFHNNISRFHLEEQWFVVQKGNKTYRFNVDKIICIQYEVED